MLKNFKWFKIEHSQIYIGRHFKAIGHGEIKEAQRLKNHWRRSLQTACSQAGMFASQAGRNGGCSCILGGSPAVSWGGWERFWGVEALQAELPCAFWLSLEPSAELRKSRCSCWLLPGMWCSAPSWSGVVINYNIIHWNTIHAIHQ